MDFPLTDLMDEQACYDYLVDALHPGGLRCPACSGRDFTLHRAHRDPVRDYRCACGRVFNAWTGTALQGTQRPPSQVVLLVHGIARGTPTAQLARELGCSRRHLLDLRHRLQHHAWVRWSALTSSLLNYSTSIPSRSKYALSPFSRAAIASANVSGLSSSKASPPQSSAWTTKPTPSWSPISMCP